MALEYTTYWLEISPRQALQLPVGSGALVRGTFGRALRRMTCLTGAHACSGCQLATRCVYREVFDPLPPAQHALQAFSAVPPPYVLHVRSLDGAKLAAGQPARLGITLVGSARRNLELVALALRQALEEGWLRERISLQLHRVLADQVEGLVPALDLERKQLLPHSATSCLTPEAIDLSMVEPCAVEMEWLTPTALKQAGREARIEMVQARTWLMTLLRRVALLADFYGEAPLRFDFPRWADLAGRARFTVRQLRRQSWNRYSARQGRTMPMGGLVGRVRIEGPLRPFLPLMDFARRLHVGRHAAFGLGEYRYSVEAA